MVSVEFDYRGRHYLALRVKQGSKNIRLGWRRDDVPSDFAGAAEESSSRSNLVTVKLPLGGLGVSNLRERPDEAGGAVDREVAALGVGTAEFARELDHLLANMYSQQHLQVVCGHPGAQRRNQHPESTSGGVLLRDIAMFLGDSHSAETRIAKADCAIVTFASPKKIVLLIEIEESRDGITPKTIVADAMMPVIADRIDLIRKKDDIDLTRKKDDVVQVSMVVR